MRCYATQDGVDLLLSTMDKYPNELLVELRLVIGKMVPLRDVSGGLLHAIHDHRAVGSRIVLGQHTLIIICLPFRLLEKPMIVLQEPKKS